MFPCKVEPCGKRFFFYAVYVSGRLHQLRSYLKPAVLLRHVLGQHDDFAGIAPLVIIESDQLKEFVVQLNTLSGIENRGVWVAHKVGGNHFVVDVFDDTLHVGFGSFLYLFADILVTGRRAQHDV